MTAQAAQVALRVQAAQLLLTFQAGQAQSALTVKAAQAMLTVQAAQAALTAQAAAGLTAQAQAQQQAVQQQDGVWSEVLGGGMTDVSLSAANLGGRLYLFANGIQDTRIYVNPHADTNNESRRMTGYPAADRSSHQCLVAL